MKADFGIFIFNVESADGEEESRFAAIIILECHIRIAIGTYSSFKFMDCHTIMVFLFLLQNLSTRQTFVMCLTLLDLMAFHQITSIKIWSYLNAVRESKGVPAWKNVRELIVLGDILTWTAALNFLMVYLAFLVVSVYIIRRLKLIITILWVIGIAIHPLILPN